MNTTFLNLREAEKLDFEKARWEYTRTAVNVDGNLRNLERIQREHSARQAQALAEKDQLELAQNFVEYPFRKPPEEDEFMAQFALSAILKRRKFYVLDGISQMGKSDYAKSLSPKGRTLDLNCATVQEEPPLRNYNPLDYDAILLDEASAALIVRNKKLMQGPPVPVDLGSTQSNMYTYKVYVYKKKLIVSTNKWREQVESLPDVDDRKWLAANAIVVDVKEPLFIRPPQAEEG